MTRDLDPQQLRAATVPEGPVLITAGPGTGKTKTLASRVVYLLEQGVAPEAILALTFTHKAAEEMRQRVRTLRRHRSSLPQITTFHAFCHSLLTKLTGNQPLLASETERQHVIRDIKKAQALKGVSIRELSLRLSLAKSLPKIQNPDSDIAKLSHKYHEALKNRGLCDFDDLLLQTYDLLSENPTDRPSYKHVLIDEFQDTNELQYALLKLVLGTNNLFAIGDPLQSIYGFRGARAEVFDRFTLDWPDAQAINLSTNYRSTPQVVRLSHHIFPDSPQLTAARKESGSVRCIEVLNEYSEARWVITEVERSIGGSTMLSGHKHHGGAMATASFCDFAVLYRSHRTATVLRRLLDESGLPYQVAGEGSPYQHPAVTALLGALEERAEAETELPNQVMNRLANNLGFDTSLPAVRMLHNAAVRFDGQSIRAYLDHVKAIAQQEFYDPDADAITLLTIHAAKGLEFNHVFLIGAEEGLLPHRRPYQEPDLGEERRLFYVAATRAATNLDILHTKKRSGKNATTSRFVQGLPAAVMPRLEDPDMASQQRRLQKRVAKRSQTSLF